MLEAYIIGLTLMGGAVTFFLSMKRELYVIEGNYIDPIYTWKGYDHQQQGKTAVEYKVYRYSASSILLGILITLLWPISIIPCAGYLVGSRMRTRA